MGQTKKKVVVITGPTASGKSALAVSWAKEVDGEIISADSMQIYRYMDIGTAKPKKEEMQGIPHYMLDEIFPDEYFSVAQYKERATYYIEKVLSRKKIPIVVGGTGLYINALIYNYDFTDIEIDWKYREKLLDEAETRGVEFLYEKLKKIDPREAEKIHPNNVKRVIRALEIYHKTQVPKSEHVENSRKSPPPFDYKVFGITMKREVLYDRINKRVDKMIEEGLVDEVKSLLARGYSRDSIALQALGYKEIIKYIYGEVSLEEAVYTIKRDTRRFAKRQITWFKRIPEIVWLDVSNESIDSIVKLLAARWHSKGTYPSI